MKKKLAAVLLSAALIAPTYAQQHEPLLTPVQKLVVGLQVANAATAIFVGPFLLLPAIITGRTEELCHFLEGDKKPSSFDPNNEGRDQCPKGIWLRTIPLVLKD